MPCEPYSSVVASLTTRNGSSARFRMSVRRRCRVRIRPRMTNASVYRVRSTSRSSPPRDIESNMAGRIRRGDARVRLRRALPLPARAGGHEMFGALLEILVQRPDRLQGVDLVGGFVRPKGGDPREPERVARLMTGRTDDDVERDLDDDAGFDLPIAAEPGDRVRLEPLSHLRDLGVGEA